MSYTETSFHRGCTKFLSLVKVGLVKAARQQSLLAPVACLELFHGWVDMQKLKIPIL